MRGDKHRDYLLHCLDKKSSLLLLLIIHYSCLTVSFLTLLSLAFTILNIVVLNSQVVLLSLPLVFQMLPVAKYGPSSSQMYILFCGFSSCKMRNCIWQGSFHGNSLCCGLWKHPYRIVSILPLPEPKRFYWFQIHYYINFSGWGSHCIVNSDPVLVGGWHSVKQSRSS